jgi:hypothetical protein
MDGLGGAFLFFFCFFRGLPNGTCLCVLAKMLAFFFFYFLVTPISDLRAEFLGWGFLAIYVYVPMIAFELYEAILTTLSALSYLNVSFLW